MLRNKKFLILLIVILLLITGYFIYMFLKDTKDAKELENDQDSNQEQVDEGQQPDDELEETKQSRIPEGWFKQSSETFGYSIGVPERWYYRFFGETRMIGMDPNPIPEASEYAGMIVFTIDERPYESMVAALKAGLESVSETDNTINSLNWVRIEGVISEEDIFYAGQMVVHGVISHNGASYRLTYSSAKETFNANLETFNDVLETISFD